MLCVTTDIRFRFVSCNPGEIGKPSQQVWCCILHHPTNGQYLTHLEAHKNPSTNLCDTCLFLFFSFYLAHLVCIHDPVHKQIPARMS
jgi:hypothetical protein